MPRACPAVDCLEFFEDRGELATTYVADHPSVARQTDAFVNRRAPNQRSLVGERGRKPVAPVSNNAPRPSQAIGRYFFPWNVKSCVWFPVTVLRVDVTVTAPPDASVDN
jgi:hypothetical protein